MGSMWSSILGKKKPVSFSVGDMVNLFIDELQQTGFRQLTQGFGEWSGEEIFGSDKARTEQGKDLFKLLVGLYNRGLVLAGVSVTKMDATKIAYINTYLIHHMMRCLLSTKVPQAQVNGLDSNQSGCPELPLYDGDVIAQFQKEWIALAYTDEVKTAQNISSAATKKFLAVPLEARILELTKTIGVSQLVLYTSLICMTDEPVVTTNRNQLFSPASKITHTSPADNCLDGLTRRR